MGQGYESFKEYVRANYFRDVTNPQTHEIEDWLLSGVPTNVIANNFNLPVGGLEKIMIGLPRERKAANRRELVSSWYAASFGSGDGELKLEKYIGTYSEQAIFCKIGMILDNLWDLREKGYHFPYQPTERDAYLFGANLGNGSISDQFEIKFTGNQDHLQYVQSLIPFKGYPAGDGLLFSKHFGRFFHALGLPKGERAEAKFYLPEWIKEERYARYFLAGLFDTISDSAPRHLRLRLSSHVSVREDLERGIKGIGEMIKNFGIALTYRGVGFSESGNKVTGYVCIKHDSQNLKDLVERIPVRRKFR